MRLKRIIGKTLSMPQSVFEEDRKISYLSGKRIFCPSLGSEHHNRVNIEYLNFYKKTGRNFFDVTPLDFYG